MTHIHNHEHKRSHGKLGWTIILNIIITVTQYIGGFMSGSLALISDAGHNLSDVLSLILGYFGEKISDKKPDKNHTYGYKRFELITSMINALSLLVIGVYIIYESFHRFLNPQPIILSIMIGVGFIGLIGNFLSIFILNKEKEKNMNMKAAYLHLFYDTLSSVFVIVSGLVIYFTKFYMLDVVVSFVIAIMIFWSSFGILKTSFHLIMQGVPKGVDLEKVLAKIKSIKGVNDVHKLHIWGINSNENHLSCHIYLEKGFENKTDELLKRINKQLEKDYDIKHTSIQIEKENLCKRGEN